MCDLFYLHYNPKLENTKCIEHIKSQHTFTNNIEEANKLMVIGGDGTLLHALRKFKMIKIPIYAINHGHKGILLPIPLNTSLENLQYNKIQRLNSNFGLFLNEIVYGNSFGTLNEFSIFINNKLFKTVRCDNIIIATSSGCTGYSLSANGPFIFDGIVVSCLAIQDIFRTMVLPLDYVIRVVGRKGYIAMVDGVDRHESEAVEVRRGDELLFASHYDEFETKKQQFDKVFNAAK